MKTMEDRIVVIETCLNDIENFICMYRDGEYESDHEFIDDVETMAEAIRREVNDA